MPTTVQVGVILIKEWPLMTQFLGLESEPYSGNWSLVTFRRKNDVSSGSRVCRIDRGPLPECALVLPRAFSVARGKFLLPQAPYGVYPFLRLAKTLPILMSVSATTPNPTQRSIPSSPR